MTSLRGGSWSVGTKDDDTVYLDRYSGDLVDGKPSGDLIVSANLDPDEAHNVGLALIDKANKLNPPAGRIDPSQYWPTGSLMPALPAEGNDGRWVKLGRVSVDSAVLGISDPSGVRGPYLGIRDTSKLADTWGSGIQFSSGFGDGSYDVWGWLATYETTGSPDDERIAFVAMTLIDESDLKEWGEMP